MSWDLNKGSMPYIIIVIIIIITSYAAPQVVKRAKV